jgi:uncharacterized protein involved in tellurium resistance
MGFDFSKFKIPGLFSQQKEVVNEVKPEVEQDNKISYRRHGFLQAGMMKGKTESLKICLVDIYEQHIAEIGRDEAKQEELRKPVRAKLMELKTEIGRIRSQVNMFESEIIPARKNRIEDLRKEIADIRKNPEQHTGTHVGIVTFYIGAFILVLLSIYLFVFYSSASYSAFFKEFKPDDIVITKAIFDPNAIKNSFRDGMTELIFIMTIPFVFIGLGYLVHKFQEIKGRSKYVKIAALLILTFIFDSIIGYEITEKIYNIKRENDITGNLPEYTFKLAFSNVGFWLVIFAGFVVYLIWGFVFDFIMDAHSKLDMVKVAINTKRERIAEIEKEIQESENKIIELRIANDKNSGEAAKLQNIIDGTIIQPRAIKEALSQFMVGWYMWLTEGREYNRSEHNKIYEDFVSSKIDTIESAINPN